MLAWWGAHAIHDGHRTWAYILDGRILDPKRMIWGGPMLDTDRLFDEVYRKEIPLPVEALQAQDIPIYCSVTDADAAEIHYQDLREGDPVLWLSASGRLPFASGPPVTIAGKRYLDGGVMDPVPVRWAVEELGATHVTLISNNVPSAVKPGQPKWALELACRKFPNLRASMEAHDEHKREAYAYAQSPPNGVRIDIIRPQWDLGVSRITRDLGKVNLALQHGRDVGKDYLNTQSDS